MTLVIAYRTDEGTVMMADRVLTLGDKIMNSADSKILEISENFALACTGPQMVSYVIADIARDYAALETPNNPREFANYLLEAMKVKGYVRFDLDAECDIIPCSVIIVMDGRPYCIDYSCGLTEYDDPYVVIGGPHYVATGALAMLPVYKTNADAVSGLKRVFKAVSRHVAYIRPPYDISILNGKPNGMV